MKVTSEIQTFIESHIQLIKQEDFVNLYDKARRFNKWFPKNLTETLLRAEIDPLTYMDIIPKNYLYEDETLNNFEMPAHIKSIESYAFGYCSNLKKVSFSERLTDIEDGAFCSTGLTEVSLPNSVQTLRSSAFYGCISLKEIDLPANLTELESGVLENCISLMKIEIPEKVITIDRFAFSGCKSLSRVDIPDSVEVINERAFANCAGLTSMTLGTNLKYVDKNVWYLCSELTSLSYKGTVEQWNKILKDEYWNNRSSIQIIHCIDGDINL